MARRIARKALGAGGTSPFWGIARIGNLNSTFQGNQPPSSTPRPHVTGSNHECYYGLLPLLGLGWPQDQRAIELTGWNRTTCNETASLREISTSQRSSQLRYFSKKQILSRVDSRFDTPCLPRGSWCGLRNLFGTTGHPC